MNKVLLLASFFVLSGLGCFFLPLGFSTPELPAGMPSDQLFRTNTASFNERYLFVLDNGHLWLKQKESRYGHQSDWMCLGTFQYPYHSIMSEFFISKVDQISVDGAYMVIISNGRIFQSSDGNKPIDKIIWTDRYGFPFSAGMGMTLPEFFSTWSASLNDPEYQKYYMDGNGIKFKVFVGHIYGLSKNQTDIHFMDGWFHRDSEYQIGGPVRDRFKMVAMSVSGSVLMVMNKYGDIFTSHQDFDVLGANPILKYTYDSFSINDYTRIYDLEYQRKLPYAKWQIQAKINGQITGKLTVFSNGEGQTSRILRVQGKLPTNETGYFEKGLMDASWLFVQTDEVIDPAAYIANTPAVDNSETDLAPSLEFSYTGHSGNMGFSISNFNFYSSPADLMITNSEGGNSIWKLHHHIYFRDKAMENVGTEGSPLLLKGVMEVPSDLADLGDLQPYYSVYLKTLKPGESGRYIPVTIEVTDRKMTIKSTLFLNNPIQLSRN